MNEDTVLLVDADNETEAKIVDREGTVFAESTSTQFVVNTREDISHNHEQQRK